MFAAIKSPTSLVDDGFTPSGAISSVTTFSLIESATASRMAAPASISAKAYSNIIAADRIVAIGFAMFLPAACGYEP